MDRFMNFVCNWVFPVAGGVWCSTIAVMCGCFLTAFFGGWEYAQLIDGLMDRCLVLGLSSALAVLFPILCLAAVFAGQLTGEWLVMRSRLYQRADREVQFWHDAYKDICQELNDLRRQKRAG